jgi:hypothetical protein
MKKSPKQLVQAHGEFVLDYVEHFKRQGFPSFYVGRGKVAGNTSPIPSGLHNTPAQAWKAAASVLEVLDGK